jgi:DNA primase
VKITRPDKVLFPEDRIIKRELVDYYRHIASWMVPHLRGRPLTLESFPDAINGMRLIQKSVSGYYPEWIKTVFARRVAEVAVDEEPKHRTLEARKNERRGRVYIDSNRNAYAQTVAPVYAVRARPAAPVLVPLDWHELQRKAFRPDGVTIRTNFAPLEKAENPWKDFWRRAVSLNEDRFPTGGALCSLRSIAGRGVFGLRLNQPAALAALTALKPSLSKSMMPATCTTIFALELEACWCHGRCPKDRHLIPG